MIALLFNVFYYIKYLYWDILQTVGISMKKTALGLAKHSAWQDLLHLK